MKTFLKLAIAFLGIAFAFSSCQSDLEDSGIESPANLKDVYNIPIQSLFDQTRAVSEVLNGECVIGAIQYCGDQFGLTISKEEIVKYFGNKVQTDSQGNITGIVMNTEDWDAALNHWFTATAPNTQYLLIQDIANGKIACCRLGSNRSHAVVLVGVNESKQEFIYYDPVLGGSNHTTPFSNIYDPRVITKK